MSFERQMEAAADRVERKARALHDGVCALAHSSIVEGSPVTGSLGQLVDSGNLKGSWINEPLAPFQNQISTNKIYAPQMEDGTREGRKLVQHSEVGGFHAVALTVQAWPKIVAKVSQDLEEGDSDA